MINSVSEMAHLWDKALKSIETKLNEPKIFNSFFEGSYINAIKGDTILIVVNSSLAIQLMSKKYYSMIEETITELTESIYKLDFIEESEIVDINGIELTPNNKKQNFFANSIIQPSLTFDSFVVGSFNREAYQASLLIAQNPGKMFNPLFIHSHSGLGKTHLMHGIANYIIKERNPNAKILYITANDFLEEYIKYVRGDKDSETIKEYVSGFDVLLLDDVQFLADKIKTQETFFYIFENMVNQGKQIVITSDKHPNELKNLEERLISRFNQGLVVNIKDPDENTCITILERKIESSGLDITKFDDAVLHFFASKFSKNVRELEGALNRLIFHICTLHQVDYVTLEIAAEAVQSLVPGTKLTTQIDGQKIIEIVSDYYHLSTSQLTGKLRTGQIALARHIAIYLIRINLDLTLKEIGDLFGGRDHTSIMHGIEHVEKELKTDPQMKVAIDELNKLIKK